MQYYKKNKDNFEITISNFKLQNDGWIEYKIGEEPQELLDFINNQANIQKILVKIEEAKQYLNSTDFYYARKTETGEEIPSKVIEKRQEAREFIRANE